MADKINATGQILPDVRYTNDPEELRLLEKPIGKWGRMWQDWIKSNYPGHVNIYIMAAKWQIIPRQIDEKAEKRWFELDELYHRDNPRPDTTDSNILLQWETACKLWVEDIIMKEIVFVRYEVDIL